MSSRIFTGVQSPPNPRSKSKDERAPGTGAAVTERRRLNAIAAASRPRSERPAQDSVRWDEPAALVALAIAIVISGAVVVLLVLAIV